LGNLANMWFPPAAHIKNIRAPPPNPFHALTSNSVAVASTCASRSTTQVPPCHAHADVSLHLSTIRPFECFRPLVQAFLKVYPCKTREVQALGRSTWNSKVSLSNLWHRAYIGPRGGTCQINSLKRKTLKISKLNLSSLRLWRVYLAPKWLSRVVSGRNQPMPEDHYCYHSRPLLHVGL
jgi:hypothetical protein